MELPKTEPCSPQKFPEFSSPPVTERGKENLSDLYYFVFGFSGTVGLFWAGG
jgi:hypothetical protein